ncbi:MAG: protein-ADP-ribose hydrolase [Ruminococcus sp.]|nr:protein-ADP-ribose hydrolase [Ruminococcus sp.]
MNQAERRIYLLKELLSENPRFRDMKVPYDRQEQKNLLRSLMNIRMPAPVGDNFLKVQDEYLKTAIKEKGITELSELSPVKDDIYLWQGDITTIECDAIVNAANSQLLGCFHPLHNCIDNCIHTFSGIQLRNICNDIMEKQGYEEPTGRAKITPAFNLPCKYVIHTVGPVVNGRLTEKHRELLKSSYRSCLCLAEENGVKSIAFCCISTGVFGFPQYEAAQIATQTVEEYKVETGSNIKVIFNVFKDEDLRIYQEILG